MKNKLSNLHSLTFRLIYLSKLKNVANRNPEDLNWKYKYKRLTKREPEGLRFYEKEENPGSHGPRTKPIATAMQIDRGYTQD